jgi:hypothetical protein
MTDSGIYTDLFFGRRRTTAICQRRFSSLGLFSL